MPQATPTVRRKTGWKQFLTPGWVITAVLVVLFTYTAFTVLAPWQLGKNTRTQATNHRLDQAFHSAPVDITSVLPAGTTTIAEDDEWKRVTITGTFDNAGTLILRNRPVDSHPALHILTPITLDDGRSIMVNRGFVTPINGAEVPAIPSAPTGRTTIEAFLRLDEPAPADTATAVSGGYRHITSINTAWMSQENPTLQLITGYAQSVEPVPAGTGSTSASGADGTSSDSSSTSRENATGTTSDGVALTAIPLPQLSNGPYLSYGIQWIAFGILAPIGLGYFIYAEIRERRRARAEDTLAAMESGTRDTAATTTNPVQASASAMSTAMSSESNNPGEKASTSAGIENDGPDSVDTVGAESLLGSSVSTAARAISHDSAAESGARTPSSTSAENSEGSRARRHTNLADRYGSTRGGRRAFNKRASREEERF